jgi:RNA polymerase sigma factor (sigma-70 family)
LVTCFSQQFSGGDTRNGRTALSKSRQGGIKWGERVFDSRIQLHSDPDEAEGGYRPYNPDNGVATPVMTWVDKGILINLAFGVPDAMSLGKAYAELPSSFRMSGGETTLDEMIVSCPEGILVNRISNVDVIDQFTGMLTGATHGGCFLIKDGKVNKPVKNFRFIDSPFLFLNRVEAMGRPERAAFGYLEGWDWPRPPVIVPPVMVRDFNFSALADAVWLRPLWRLAALRATFGSVTVAYLFHALGPDDASPASSEDRDRYLREDAALVARLREGDDAALEHLYRTHHAAMWDVAYRYLRDTDSAEDAVHDVFRMLWERRGMLAPTGTITTYLFGAVRHRALNVLRHHGVARRAVETFDEAPPGLGVVPPSPDSLALASDREARVRRYIEALPDRTQTLVMLRWRHGLSYPDVAAALGMSTEAAKKLGQRVQAVLRPLLSELSGE